MATSVICGAASLDCDAIVDWIKSRPDCSKDELMRSKACCELLNQYSKKIGDNKELEWTEYEWFVDSVLQPLIEASAISVKFGVGGVRL